MIITTPWRRKSSSIAVLAALLAAAFSAPGEALPVSTSANVVVVTGLPGDVESETAYRAELERLLEILALPAARPRRVFVLSDTGEAGSPPAGLEVSAASGNRREFLELADELAGSEEPLTVFVWGHGGLLGGEPVFHVRGPRLRPEDFRALAESVAGPSSWVLLFRHSGAFARALRAPGRAVISSENATAFKSDPIAPGLVLELLRDAPGISFEALAERLGAATVSWYEEHHLARQEEPTLWIGEEPARELAAREAPALAEAPSVETAPSASWHKVERVDAARYPSASAVVLRRTLQYLLADSPAMQSESDELIQILTPEGAVHGDFDIAYHPPGEKITFLDLEVRRPDGTLLRLSGDEIRDVTPEALPEYRPPTRKIFSLPHAVPGAILRVHYRREWRRFPLPYIPLEIPLTGALPVVRSRIEIRVAREAPVHFAFRRHRDVEPEREKTPYGKALSWTFENLDAVASEVLAAPQRTPTLLVSTYPSWEEYAGWYRRLIRQADELTPEIAAKANELVAGAESDRDKVEALYNFVTGLRYVAVPLGVNSHRPHAAANVFENRYGDCKDKANLLNTMLRSVGVESDLVLVPRFSQAYEATPGLGFNHAISRIRLPDGEVIWADTTDDVARFGLLPPGDPGRNVLVIHDEVSSLMALPTPEPADHRLELRGEITVHGGPRPATSELEVTTSGFPDYMLRSLARALGPDARTQPVPLARLEPANGYFAMTAQSYTPAAALERDFTWKGEGAWTGLGVELGDGVLLRAPFLLPSEWRLALHERTTPLYLNRGYPLTLVQQLRFALPERASPERVPEAVESAQGPLRWRLEWRLRGAAIEAGLEVVLEKGELGERETETFRDALRRLYESLERGAIYAD